MPHASVNDRASEGAKRRRVGTHVLLGRVTVVAVVEARAAATAVMLAVGSHGIGASPTRDHCSCRVAPG